MLLGPASPYDVATIAKNASLISGRQIAPEMLQRRPGETLNNLLQRIGGAIRGESPLVEEHIVKTLPEKGGIALRAWPIVDPQEAEREGIDCMTKVVTVISWEFVAGESFDEVADRVPGHVLDHSLNENSHTVKMTALKLIFPLEYLVSKNGPDYLGKGVGQIAGGMGHTMSLWALNEIFRSTAREADYRNGLLLKLTRDETYRWFLHDHFPSVFFTMKEGSNIVRVENDMITSLERRGIRDPNIMIVTNGTCAHLVDLPTRRHNMESPPLLLYPLSPSASDINKGKSKAGLPIFESEVSSHRSGKVKDALLGGYEWGEAAYSLGDPECDPELNLGYQSKSRNIYDVPDYKTGKFATLLISDMISHCGAYDPETGMRTPFGAQLFSTLIRYNRDTKRTMSVKSIPWLHLNSAFDPDLFQDEFSVMIEDDQFVNLYNLSVASGEKMFESIVSHLMRVEDDKYDKFKEYCLGLTSSASARRATAMSSEEGMPSLAMRAIRVMGDHHEPGKRSKRGAESAASAAAASGKKPRLGHVDGKVPFYIQVLCGDATEGKEFKTDDIKVARYSPSKFVLNGQGNDTKLPVPQGDTKSGGFSTFIEIVGDGAREKYREYLLSVSRVLDVIMDKMYGVDADRELDEAVTRLGRSLPGIIRSRCLRCATSFGDEKDKKARAGGDDEKQFLTICFSVVLHALQMEAFRVANFVSAEEAKEDNAVKRAKVITDLKDRVTSGKPAMGGLWQGKDFKTMDLKKIDPIPDAPTDGLVDKRIFKVIRRTNEQPIVCEEARKPGAQNNLAALADAFAEEVIFAPDFYDRKSLLLVPRIFLKILESNKYMIDFNENIAAGLDLTDRAVTQGTINELLAAVKKYLSPEEERQVSNELEKRGRPGGGGRSSMLYSASDFSKPRHQRGPCRDRLTVIEDMKCNKLQSIETFRWFITNNIPLPVGFICIRNPRVGAGCVLVSKAGPETAATVIMDSSAISDLDSAHRQVHLSFTARSVTVVRSPRNSELRLYSMTSTSSPLEGGGTKFISLGTEGAKQFCARGWAGDAGDMIALMVPPGVRPENDIFDLTGRFHDELTKSTGDEPLHYATAPTITQMLNIQHVPGIMHFFTTFFSDTRIGRNTVFSAVSHSNLVLSGTNDAPVYRTVVTEGCGPTQHISSSQQIAELMHGGKFQNLMTGTMPHRKILGSV